MFMAYLRWRRFTELLSLDRPWLGELFMRKRGKPIVAAPVEKWDAEYQDGLYDRLNRSDQRHHHRLLAAMIADRWPNPRVLEIGAGEGVFYEALRAHRPARYVGVDFSKPAVDLGEVRLAPEIAIGEVKMLLGDGRARSRRTRPSMSWSFPSAWNIWARSSTSSPTTRRT
jgi:hypothetical protein